MPSFLHFVPAQPLLSQCLTKKQKQALVEPTADEASASLADSNADESWARELDGATRERMRVATADAASRRREAADAAHAHGKRLEALSLQLEGAQGDFCNPAPPSPTATNPP